MSKAHDHPYKKESLLVDEDDYGFKANDKATCLYTKGKIMEALTTDERIAEHNVKIHVSGDTIVAKGEVFTEEQKVAVNEVIRKISPTHSFKNLVSVRVLSGPEGSEAIQ